MRIVSSSREASALPFTLNLFRHKTQADLYCAVPSHLKVPMFLSDGTWAYSQAWDDGRSLPRGFDLDLAQHSCRTDGFFVFLAETPDPAFAPGTSSPALPFGARAEH